MLYRDNFIALLQLNQPPSAGKRQAYLFTAFRPWTGKQLCFPAYPLLFRWKGAMIMGKRQLQITCRFGKEEASELLFRSFLLFLRRELQQMH